MSVTYTTAFDVDYTTYNYQATPSYDHLSIKPRVFAEQVIPKKQRTKQSPEDDHTQLKSTFLATTLVATTLLLAGTLAAMGIKSELDHSSLHFKLGQPVPNTNLSTISSICIDKFNPISSTCYDFGSQIPIHSKPTSFSGDFNTRFQPGPRQPSTNFPTIILQHPSNPLETPIKNSIPKAITILDKMLSVSVDDKQDETIRLKNFNLFLDSVTTIPERFSFRALEAAEKCLASESDEAETALSKYMLKDYHDTLKDRQGENAAKLATKSLAYPTKAALAVITDFFELEQKLHSGSLQTIVAYDGDPTLAKTDAAKYFLAQSKALLSEQTNEYEDILDLDA